MGLFKVMVCSSCKYKLVYHKRTRWGHILKEAKKGGWLIKKTHQLCPECKFDLEGE